MINVTVCINVKPSYLIIYLRKSPSSTCNLLIVQFFGLQVKFGPGNQVMYNVEAEIKPQW